MQSDVTVTQAEELVSAIENAGRGYSINLVRLVDGVATYELKYRGEITEHESHEAACEALDELARREKIAAATAFLARHRREAFEAVRAAVAACRSKP